MKKVVTVVLFVLASMSINAQTTKKVNKKAAKFEFESKVIDYGTINKNADGVREFRFTNTGKSPLIITNTKGSCGCTVPSHPKKPIMPGKTGIIKVKYATNRVGPFQKTVTVTSNADEPVIRLTIKGKVIDPNAKKPVVLKKKKALMAAPKKS
jgi:hypothetical protein